MICACPCRKKFQPHRPGQKYFSPECREAARRARTTLMRLTVGERRLVEGSRKGRKGLVPTRNHPWPGHPPGRAQRTHHGPLGDSLMTSEQVRQFLGVSRWQMREWRTNAKGGGPAFIRIGRRVRYLPSDVLQFVRARKLKKQEAMRSHGEKE